MTPASSVALPLAVSRLMTGTCRADRARTHTRFLREYPLRVLGFGSGVTCWHRLRDCNDAGVWDRLHGVLLGKPWAAGHLNMSRAW